MAAKAGADEDEALFPPPPKKVRRLGRHGRLAATGLAEGLMAQVALSSAPQFLVGVQLGKGGFGQVFKGSRAYPRQSKDPYKPTHVSCSLAACCGGIPHC